VARAPYDHLSTVYEWLVPEALLEPEGAVAAFAEVADALPPGARVLDCAAGTGQLAVGLALRGFDVVACDASPGMIERTRRLARERGAELETAVRRWDELGEQGPAGPFDAVLCVGNSLTHAPGTAARRSALEQMAGRLRADGRLALTSRNWERVREAGPGLEVADRLVVRWGQPGLVVRAWTMPAEWEAPHHLDVAVALIDPDGEVERHGERLTFWPFRREALEEDLRHAGLAPVRSTYAPEAERYLVLAAPAG
jgi:SAM-dependent methyltransferase